MGRVLLGAVIVGVIGGLIGFAPSYRAIEIRQSSGPQMNVAEPLQAISIMIGFGAGAIVGAIAGLASALPGARPVPRWMWLSLLAVMLVALVLSAAWLLIPGPSAPGPRRPSAPDIQGDKISPSDSKPAAEPQPIPTDTGLPSKPAPGPRPTSAPQELKMQGS